LPPPELAAEVLVDRAEVVVDDTRATVVVLTAATVETLGALLLPLLPVDFRHWE